MKIPGYFYTFEVSLLHFIILVSLIHYHFLLVMKNYFICCIASLVGAITLTAQAPKLTFTHLTNEQGLSNSTIEEIRGIVEQAPVQVKVDISHNG